MRLEGIFTSSEGAACIIIGTAKIGDVMGRKLV